MVMFVLRTRMKKWSHKLLGFEVGNVKKKEERKYQEQQITN